MTRFSWARLLEPYNVTTKITHISLPVQTYCKEETDIEENTKTSRIPERKRMNLHLLRSQRRFPKEDSSFTTPDPALLLCGTLVREKLDYKIKIKIKIKEGNVGEVRNTHCHAYLNFSRISSCDEVSSSQNHPSSRTPGRRFIRR